MNPPDAPDFEATSDSPKAPRSRQPARQEPVSAEQLFIQKPLRKH